MCLTNSARNVCWDTLFYKVVYIAAVRLEIAQLMLALQRLGVLGTYSVSKLYL